MSQDLYRPSKFSFLPTVVKNILIINGLLYLAMITIKQVYRIDITDYLGLHYFSASAFKPHQLITYMFMHSFDLNHIFFNMFALWMFGVALENHWGAKRFFIYYMITGIGAGLIQNLVTYVEIKHIIDATGVSISSINPAEIQRLYNSFVTVGASGAVFGILLAFGMTFPNQLIYIYFLIPLKAKYFVILYGAAELFFGVSGYQSGVAHFAHLGGMLFGILLILYWRHNRNQQL